MEANVVKMQYRNLLIQVEENENRYRKLIADMTLLTNVKDLLMDFSENTRDVIKNKLESLVNSALKCIFSDKDMKFKIIINKTKKIIFYDLYIETDGNITPLYDAKGGGVLDVVTTALRISFVRMFNATLRQTIIFDEPFKNLDIERMRAAMDWLSTTSEEFNLQMIIVTHEDEIIEQSDKVFSFKLMNGVTQVETAS